MPIFNPSHLVIPSLSHFADRANLWYLAIRPHTRTTILTTTAGLEHSVLFVLSVKAIIEIHLYLSLASTHHWPSMASLRVRVPPALQAHLNLNLDSQMMQSVDYDDPDDLLLSRPKRRGFKWYPKRTFIIYLFGLLVFCIPVVLLIHAGLPSLDSIFNCGTTSETLATVTEEAAACMPNAEDESDGLAERFKKFQRGFPRLRGSSERGFPSVVEDDGIEFDWPSVKSMFAL